MRLLDTQTTSVRRPKRSLISAPYICIIVALLLVLFLGGWGAYTEWTQLRLTILRAEVSRVRSHAERTAGRLETELIDLGTDGTLREVVRQPWLRQLWMRNGAPVDNGYRAVIGADGMILAHRARINEGQKICQDWKDRSYPDAGPDVYQSDCHILNNGHSTLDIVVPITVNGQLRGTYWSGLNLQLLQTQIASARRGSMIRWGAVIGAIVIVVLLSSLSLYHITRKSAYLEHALAMAQARRIAELSELIVGLAHEVRNPLNAIRLNLYTADRVFRGEASLPTDEVTAMLGESVREIERVDELISQLLGYSRADPQQIEPIDLTNEVHNVLQFLKPTFSARGIELVLSTPETALRVPAGRGHVRQVLLNLLNNALDAVPDQTGVIQVSLLQEAQYVYVRIRDNGPGIPANLKERIFSPFFSTKNQGTGLGLAVVRGLMEVDGGEVVCETVQPQPCCMRVRWHVWT